MAVPDEMYAFLGAYLRAKRQQVGVSQEQLGELIGMSRQSVSNVEAGRYPVQFHVFMQMCAALYVDPAEVVTAVAGDNPDLFGDIER